MLFDKLIRKMKRNSIVKWFYFVIMKRTGVVSVIYHGKNVKSLFVAGKEIIPKYMCENTKINDNTLVYFKINRFEHFTVECINKWIDAISVYDLQYVFVCDNDVLKHEVLKKCNLNDNFTGFLKSDRRGLKKIAKNLYTDKWEFATYAHLTPFYHAKLVGKRNFWCIDADDTMFLMKSDKIAMIMQEVEKISIKSEISAISLDMWRSKTLGKHWSLGVLYINDNIDFCKVFASITNNQWMQELNIVDDAYNLDWFMTYLKDIKKYNIQSFYVENAGFIHWSDNLIINNSSSWINMWKDGKVVYPIMKYIYQDDRYGVIEIADCIKIDVGIDESEYKKYMFINSDYNHISDTRRSLLGIETE